MGHLSSQFDVLSCPLVAYHGSCELFSGADMEPKPWPEVSVSNQDYKSAAVIIVGAGFGGLCQAIELIKNNIHNFVILERGSNVGGTWLDNKYPGYAWTLDHAS